MPDILTFTPPNLPPTSTIFRVEKAKTDCRANYNGFLHQISQLGTKTFSKRWIKKSLDLKDDDTAGRIDWLKSFTPSPTWKTTEPLYIYLHQPWGLLFVNTLGWRTGLPTTEEFRSVEGKIGLFFTDNFFNPDVQVRNCLVTSQQRAGNTTIAIEIQLRY